LDFLVGLRTRRRRLSAHDVGDEPADRIVENRVIVDSAAYGRAMNAKDAAGIAPLFIEDVVCEDSAFIGTGPIYGYVNTAAREGIEARLSEAAQ
jgi:hypothetical protein